MLKVDLLHWKVITSYKAYGRNGYTIETGQFQPTSSCLISDVVEYMVLVHLDFMDNVILYY